MVQRSLQQLVRGHSLGQKAVVRRSLQHRAVVRRSLQHSYVVTREVLDLPRGNML